MRLWGMARPMAWLLLAAVLLPVSATGALAAADACDVPEDLAIVHFPADHAYARFKARLPVRILVLGSTSSTGSNLWASKGLGASFKAYPRLIEAALESAAPGRSVTVTDRTAPGQTAALIVQRLPALLAETAADLVIWEAGTTDAVKRIDVNAFGDTLDDGLHFLAEKGIDVILVDVQYSPQTDSLYDFQPYLDYLQQVAEADGVNVLKRHDIMRHYTEEGRFDPGARIPADQVRNAGFVHACLARRLAGMILAAAQQQ
ncbi:MAG: hypothetical protein F8N37_05325 [Telmatospirillum sp.]|nr:hypothetical protein [Telmatospirillum sp.]